MEKIYSALPLLILLIFVAILSKYWIKNYRKKNIEVKPKETRTYIQYMHHISKRLYLMSLFLIVFLILKVVYDLLTEN